MLYFLLLIFTGGICQVQGQRWTDGHVVTSEGDTLHGLIRSDHVLSLSQKVHFDGGDGSIQIFLPTELRSFSSGAARKHIAGTVTLIGESEARPMFFEVLVEGALDLRKLNYEIRPDPSLLTDFEKEWYLLQLERDSIPVLLDPGRYRGQILDYLIDCPTIREDVNSNHYKLSDEDMTDLVAAYNDCLESTSITYDLTKEKDPTYVFLHLGALDTEVLPNDSYYRYADLGDSRGNGLFIEGGIGLEVKSWITVELSLDYRQLEQRFIKRTIVPDEFENAGEHITSLSEFDIGLVTAHVGLQLQYELMSGISPYIKGGLLTGVGLDNTLYQESVVSESRSDGLYLVNVVRKEPEYSIANNDAGTFLEFGLMYDLPTFRVGIAYGMVNGGNIRSEEAEDRIRHTDRSLGLKVSMPINQY